MRIAALTLLVAAAIAGCGGEDPAGAKDVTRDFLAALERGDEDAACAALSPGARAALQSDEEAPCPEALASLGLDSGEVTSAQVYVTQARVALSNGQYAFLGRTSSGWRLDAAGCRPAGAGKPYDCELDS